MFVMNNVRMLPGQKISMRIHLFYHRIQINHLNTIHARTCFHNILNDIIKPYSSLFFILNKVYFCMQSKS